MSDTPRTDAWKWTNDPIDELYEFARQLERELNAANDRIKRLEEAGDAMVETTTTPAADAWHKARGEAKP
jgi:hypothetical protein